VATTTTPEIDINENTNIAFGTYGLARVFSLTSASNTFKEQSASAASSNTRTHSAVFILNMNKFAAAAQAYSAGPTALSTTSFATLAQTMTVTPSVTGNVWIGGYSTFNRNALVDGDNGCKFRIQVDNADQPTGQTSDTYTLCNVSTPSTSDKHPFLLGTVANLNTSAHTVDLDGSSTQTGGQHADASVWAIPMELVAAGGGGGAPCVGIIGGRADEMRLSAPCGGRGR
jgi:hypothetical protein